MKLKIIIPCFLLLMPVLVVGQKAHHTKYLYADSGFTNKAEAKNVTINGLKDGKWMEYYNLETKTSNSNPYETTINVPTADTNAMYYDLGVYKAGKLNGVVRYYENKSNKYMFWHYFINGKKIESR